MMVELSVIVPVYNGERYLPQLLDSICAIRKISLEIILVNDGSVDKSAQIIKEYQQKDERIIYCEKENGGIVSARNHGLQKASGEYLFFADQDDRLDAQTVERALERLKKKNADMLLFSTKYFDDGGKVRECDTVFQEGSWQEHEIADIFIRKLVTRYAKEEAVSYLGHIWAAVIKRSMVAEYGIHFKRFMAIEDDLLFVLDALDHARLILTMKETGYYWRQNPDSRTRRGRYSDAHAEKMRRYYEYRTGVLLRHHVCTAEELERYYSGVRQEFILNLLDNEALRGLSAMGKACVLLRKYIENEEIKKALASAPACPLAERYKAEKSLLSKNRVFMALMYKKLKYRKARAGNTIRKWRSLQKDRKVRKKQGG